MMESVSPHCSMNAAECTAELQLLHRSAGSLQYSYTTCISNQLPPATWKQHRLTEIISMYLIKFWPWPLSDGDMGECCVESACMRQFSAWQHRRCSDHSQAQTLSTTHYSDYLHKLTICAVTILITSWHVSMFDVSGQRLRLYCAECDTAVCCSCSDIEHRTHTTTRSVV